ncbi:MAG: hypothetical protein F4X77_15275 [Acidobacteriia bacterium]|nr:hypothetical protein [Terriglobia bacterium]
MTNDPEAQDFNWVRATLDATPAAVFNSIREDIRAAVEERNASLEKAGASFRFELGKKDAGWARVLLEPVGHSSRYHCWTDFRLCEDGSIEVLHATNNPGIPLPDGMTGRPSLDLEGLLRIKVEGSEPLLQWQFIRRALRSLLFPNVMSLQVFGL